MVESILGNVGSVDDLVAVGVALQQGSAVKPGLVYVRSTSFHGRDEKPVDVFVFRDQQRHEIRYALLYHYVATPQKERAIRESRVLLPNCDDEDSMIAFYTEVYIRPRVNLTSVKPEESRSKIVAATGLTGPELVNYGLELLIPIKGLVQAFEPFRSCYQIFSDQPVPVVVLHTWNMDRVGLRGIVRYNGNHGIPHACYGPARSTKPQKPDSDSTQSTPNTYSSPQAPIIELRKPGLA